MIQLKNQIVQTVVVMSVLIVGIYILRLNSNLSHFSNHSSLLIENMEALAQDENIPSNCYLLGALDCKGYKVSYILNR